MAEAALKNFTRKMLSEKIFSCAICEQLLKAPVMIVNNVGNVCQHCVEDKQEENEWDVLPNTSLNVMLKELTFPCSFESEGCESEQLYGDLEEHEKKCIFRTVNCLLPHNDCKWKGKVKDLLAHFKEEHAKHIITSPTDVFSLEINLQKFTNIVKFLKRKNKTYVFEIKETTDGRHLLHFLWNITNKEAPEMIIKYIGEGGHYRVKLPCIPFGASNDEKNETKINLDVLNGIAFAGGILTITLKPNKCEFGNINKQILKHLECPVCKDTMRPPIHQCSSGHSVCNLCRPKLNDCPTCRQGWSTSRNFPLEGVTQAIQYSCGFSQFGCETVLLGSDISKHEDVCEFKIFECPPSNCTFTGNFMAVKNHFKANHAECLIESPVYRSNFIRNSISTETAQYFFEYGNIFKLSLKSRNSVTSWYMRILHRYDKNNKYFYVITIMDPQREQRKLIKSNLCLDMDTELTDYNEVSFSDTNLATYVQVNSNNQITYSCELHQIKSCI